MLVPLAVAWALPKPNRRVGFVLGVIMAFYLGAVVLPSAFSFRGVAPATCLLCILSFPVLERLARELSATLRPLPARAVQGLWLAMAIVVLFIGINNPFRPLLTKRTDLRWNRAVLDAIYAHGGKVDSRIFSNDFLVYPLDDRRFVTFHNYGGYMLLDPLYNATMPRPAARTAEEWQAFFDHHAFEFVVLKPGPKIADFLENRDPARWTEIHRDALVVVFKRQGPLPR